MLSHLLKRLAANHGFMNSDDVAQLAEEDRLRQCLVRCNGGRFVCASQDVAHFTGIIERDCKALWGKEEDHGIITAVARGADYVRDVALLSSDPAFKGDYRPVTQSPSIQSTRSVPTPRQIEQRMDAAFNRFRESDCGGVFDGFGVSSDADPGL